jgi:hypothetical protein
VFAILHNIALICCNFDISVEVDTMDHEVIRIKICTQRNTFAFEICIDMEGLFVRQIPSQVFIAT